MHDRRGSVNLGPDRWRGATWNARRRRCTGSLRMSPDASGTTRSKTHAWCRTSRSTTSIASRGSTSGIAKSLPRVQLPRTLPATTASAVAVLAGTADLDPTEPDLPHLSRLLHLSAGVVRTMERPYATWLFRAAGSAGGRFPLELYVAVPDGTALPAGVHWYDPQDHALVQVGPDARRRRRPRWSSPASRGAPAGATASGGTGTCTGTPAPCSPRCSRWPIPRGSPRGCTAVSRTPPSPRSSARMAARVARRRRRARRGRACDRGDRCGRSGRSRRGPVGLPARHGGAASGDARVAGTAVGSRPPGRRVRPGNGSGRGGRARTRFTAADGPHPRRAGAPAAHLLDAPLRGCRSSALRRRARRREASTPGVYRWPELSAPVRPGGDARRAVPGVPRAGTRSRRRIRRDLCDRRRRTRRPGVPRGAARRRSGRGQAAPARLRPGRERLGDDVPRQRGARAAGRAAGRTAVHLRRRAGVRIGGRRTHPARRPPSAR